MYKIYPPHPLCVWCGYLFHHKCRCGCFIYQNCGCGCGCRCGCEKLCGCSADADADIRYISNKKVKKQKKREFQSFFHNMLFHNKYSINWFHFTSAQGLGISILLLQLSRSHHCEHFEPQKHLPQMNINAKNDFWKFSEKLVDIVSGDMWDLSQRVPNALWSCLACVYHHVTVHVTYGWG